MSIYIKNIQLSIGGTPSDQFKIEIEGIRYWLGDFRISQRLLEPCRLSFRLWKSPDEDISEVQFAVCRAIIGQSLTLRVTTGSIEQEIASFNEGQQNTDIEFEGTITSARAKRSESEYGVAVEAQSLDATLMDHPHCEVYNEERLSGIVADVLRRNSVKGDVQPEHEEPIFYTAQYNETNHAFLQRLARRYGEWMFSTGKKLHFGRLADQDEIVLKYPSQDVHEYSVHLQTRHPAFRFSAAGYNEASKGTYYDGEDQRDTGNKLSDAAFRASKENYAQRTLATMASASMEQDDKVQASKMEKPEYAEQAEAERHSLRADMLVYEGQTDCSRIRIGARLIIVDNYISDAMANKKNEVQQDEIIITEVDHLFSFDDEYKNVFRGITATVSHPPYHDTLVHPVCIHPVRARVVDVNDPRHWGRVRVTFPWQDEQWRNGHKNGQTPWIHVVQPYANALRQPHHPGTLLIPELQSTVLVDFEEGNFERPYVVGTHFGQMEPVDDGWYPGDNRVKAIRTASGHTIEIHDNISGANYGKGGYIRIYDSETQNYEVLLSTDEKLIRLKSKGNIELYADRDIKMKAGHDVEVEAGHNIRVKAGRDYGLEAGHDIVQEAGNEYAQHSGVDMYVDAGNDMSVTVGNNQAQSVGNDRTTRVDHNDQLDVAVNQMIAIGDSKDEQVENTVQLTATTIRTEASDQLLEYSDTHHQKATSSIGINAGMSIDIKATNVKIN